MREAVLHLVEPNPGRDHDPYDFEAILGDAASALARGVRGPMSRFAEIAGRLYPGSRSLGMLRRVASAGEVAVGPRLIVSGPDRGDREAAFDFAREAMVEAERVASIAGTVVVEVAAEGPDLAFLSVDVPGLFHILVTGKAVRNGNLRATIYHEVGHAALRSGCRFLDEAFAVHMGQIGDPERAFPFPRRRMAATLESHRGALHDLHALLTLDAEGDVYFDATTSDETARKLIYAQGWALVRRVLHQHGAEQMRALYRGVASARPQDRVAVVERILGVSVAKLHSAAFGAPSPDLGTPPDDGSRSRACISALRARRAQGPDDPAVLIPLVRQLLALPEAGRGGVGAMVRAEIRELIGRDGLSGSPLRGELAAELARAEALGASTRSAQLGRAYLAEVAAASAAEPPKDAPPPAPGSARGAPRLVGAAVVDLDRAEAAVGRGFRLDVRRLAVAEGEVVAVVGPNGAGKTTLLGAVAGLVACDRVEGTVLGQPVSARAMPRAVRRKIGVQLQRYRQLATLSVGEMVDLHAAVHGASSSPLIEALGIGEIMERRYGVLSEGQRRRIDVYLAAAHRPRLLLLDEPTSGLDANFRSRVRTEVIEAAGQDGRTVIYATHSTDDLAPAGRVVAMVGGRVEIDGSPQGIIEEWLGPFRGELVCENADALALALGRLRATPGRYVVWNRVGPRAAIFGGGDLRATVEALGRSEGVRSYSFGLSGLVDILSLTSNLSKFDWSRAAKRPAALAVERT